MAGNEAAFIIQAVWSFLPRYYVFCGGEQAAEGMQIMRILGKNMAWFLKCKETGEKAGIALPEQEAVSFTNFIH